MHSKDPWELKDFFIVYDIKIKKIINLLIEADDEISDVFRFRNQDQKDIISAKVQLTLVFTFIDILGNYYDAYLGNTNSSHAKRFNNFVEKFCFVNENIYFKNRKHMKNITPEALKNLRNGLVHFYSIGIQKNIMIASDTVTDDYISETINNYSIDRNPIIIIPSELQLIAQEGAQLFTKNFNINEDHTDNEKMEKMYALDRILEKIEGEGSILIRPGE